MADATRRVDPRPGRRRRRAKALAVVGAATMAVIGLRAVARGHHGLILINETPSEPQGLYVRHREPIRRGTIVAFLAPPAAFPYADRRASYLRTVPIIKAVAAIAGDHVCTEGDALIIDGVRRASIRSHDSGGALLPRWIACRDLRPGELFVYSDRVSNSFDSRYYGPVSVARVQTYRPLITTNGFGR